MTTRYEQLRALEGKLKGPMAAPVAAYVRECVQRFSVESAEPALPVPRISNIDATVLAALAVDHDCFNMSVWHANADGDTIHVGGESDETLLGCATTHCRAGWAVHLGGLAGYDLERIYGPVVAGALLYVESQREVPDFFGSNTAALYDMLRATWFDDTKPRGPVVLDYDEAHVVAGLSENNTSRGDDSLTDIYHLRLAHGETAWDPADGYGYGPYEVPAIVSYYRRYGNVTTRVAFSQLSEAFRFRCYARAHGNSVTQQFDEDEHCHDDPATGFVLWIWRQWKDWRLANGIKLGDPHGRIVHERFDEYLRKHADKRYAELRTSP